MACMSGRRDVDKWSAKGQTSKPKTAAADSIARSRRVTAPLGMSTLEKALGTRSRAEAALIQALAKGAIAKTSPLPRKGHPSTKLALAGCRGRPYSGLAKLTEQDYLSASNLYSSPKFSTGLGSIFGLFGQNHLYNFERDGLRTDRVALKRDQLVTGVDFHKAVGKVLGQEFSQARVKVVRKVVEGKEPS